MDSESRFRSCLESLPTTCPIVVVVSIWNVEGSPLGSGGCEPASPPSASSLQAVAPKDRHSSIEAAASAGRLANFMRPDPYVWSIGVHHARTRALRRAFAGVWD